MSYIAIFVASVASMTFGALWYSPKLFGNKNQDVEEALSSGGVKQNQGIRFIGSFIFQIITTSALFVIIQRLEIRDTLSVLEIGTLLWFGFLLPWEANLALWHGKTRKLFLVSILHHLGSILISAFTLSLFF
jgi:hypothetical protein